MAKKKPTPSPPNPTNSTQNPEPPSSNPSSTSSIPQETPKKDELPTSESRIDKQLPQETQSSSMINKEKVEIYWNSLNLVQKRKFLQVSYSYLLEFSKNFSKAEDFLLEATSFYDVHKQWKCWICCSCNRSFPDSQLHFGHVARTHLKDSLPLAPSLVFPLNLAYRILLINDGIWEPVDTSVAIPILKKQLKSLANKRASGENNSQFNPKQFFLGQTWPLSNDPIRAALLKEIQGTLQETLAADRLLTIHIAHVLADAANKMQKYFEGVWLLDLGLDQTHICICLLNAKELQEILDVLKRITSSSFDDTSKETSAMDGTKVNIGLDKEMFRVLFDESRELPSAESLLSWIYSSPSSEQDFELWKHQIQENESKAIATFDNALQKQMQELSGDEDGIPMNKAGTVIRKVSSVIHIFASNMKSIAAVDYLEILSFLVKSFIKLRLEKYASNDPTDNPENTIFEVGGDQLEEPVDDDQLEEPADDDQQLLDPEQNDVHSEGNPDSGNVLEDFQKWVAEDEDKIEQPSHDLKRKGKEVEVDIEPERNLSGASEKARLERNLRKLLGWDVSDEESEEMEESERRAAWKMLGITEEEAANQAAIERSIAEQGANSLRKNDADKGASSSEMLGENTRRRTEAWVEDYVPKEDLSSIQKEWCDAVHEWFKTVVFFEKEVDKKGALEQFALQKEEVLALCDKFFRKASMSK